MILLWLGLGLILLAFGGELLVRGASRLAALLGLSPLVIGLTVVSFGTSSPELAVSVQAAISGQPDIALGNVVGSNILNVLLILGVCALLLPLVISQQLIRQDVPIMIGCSLLCWVLARDGALGFWDGIVFLGLLAAYIGFAVWTSRREKAEVQKVYEAEFKETRPGLHPMLSALLFIGAGLVALVVGARWLVFSAADLATTIGVSELVISLTVVAAGTSAPEIATSIVATLRGERDIAIGNIVGSNIFNILGILGVGAVVAPLGVAVAPSAFSFDIPVMIAVAVACLPVFFTGNVLARWEGAVFLAYYVFYTSYLVMTATRHAATYLFTAALWFFVIPLTVLTMVLAVLRAVRGEARVRREAEGEERNLL